MKFRVTLTTLSVVALLVLLNPGVDAFGSWGYQENIQHCSDGSCVSKPPNILLFLHDDQDILLGSPDYMHYTQEHMVHEGVTFRRGYVTTSLCCPSRASILRGQYVSNHQIYTNNLPKGGFNKYAALGYEEDSLPNWLKKRGYVNALFGKYLNDYREGNVSHVPEDWDEFLGILSDDEDPWNITQYTHNGQLYDGTGQYQTDTIRDKTVEFLDKHFLDRRGRLRTDAAPFFIWLAPEAPHSPADPAERHETLFPTLVHPRIRAWNESAETMALKPPLLRDLPPTDEVQIERDDTRFRNRILSLQATDEMLHAVVKRLEALGQLENTVIIYTSDNGMHFNQHRLTNAKRMAYEEDIRVPFYIRGPGIPKHAVSDTPVLNIDIAPTILDIAGVEVPSFVDGVSFLEAARQAQRWSNPTPLDSAISIPLRDRFMVFASHAFKGAQGINEYQGIRKLPTPEDPSDYLYNRWWDGFGEFYDHTTDPEQRINLYYNLTSTTLAPLEAKLDEFRVCSGASCRAL